MRIFLSYGHDSNEALVRRIKADLEELRGHDVWFDRSEIKAGHDWRRTIADGIVSSDGVLSFLSKHSVRDPGVCLDEIAIAVGVNGGNVQTILVESESDVSPPATVSHIQWLDMHDWRDRQQSGGSDWEEWYRAKFSEIVGVIESDTVRRFAGEIQQLQTFLKPISSDPRILELIGKPFVGREWVLEGLESWRTATDRTSRMFWITGAPGTGKSAFSAHLAHFGREKVIAAIFCEYDKPDHRDPKHIFRSLAFQIATRLPDYRRFLLKLLTEDQYELDRKSASEMFDDLLAKPLQHAIDGGRQRYVIILDGLDEAGHGGRNELVSMLARYVPRLPEWFGIVTTSRPESSVTAPLKGLKPFILNTSNESNQNDLIRYLRVQLEAHLAGRHDAELLLKRILKRSEGVFLYVDQFCREVQQGRIALDEPDSFPEGLGGIYHQFFDRQFSDASLFERDVRPLLNLIVARRGPISLELLSDVLGVRITETRRRLQQLGSLFIIDLREEAGIRQSIVSPFHKSLDDWLTGVDADTGYNLAGAWTVDPFDGEKAIAAFGQTIDPKKRIPDRYLLRHLIPHFASVGDILHAYRLVTDLKWLEATVSHGFTYDIPGAFNTVIQHLPVKSTERELLTLLLSVLRRHLHFIARHASDYPQSLFQSVWNICRWVDDVNPPNGIAPSSRESLSSLMDDWLATFSSEDSQRVWLRVRLPPSLSLVSPVKATLQSAPLITHHYRIHTVTCLAASGDGNTIACGYRDAVVSVWDVQSGCVLFRTECDYSSRYADCGQPRNWVCGVGLDNDGASLVYGFYNNLYVVSTIDSRTLLERRMNDSWVSCVAITGDGQYAACGTMAGRICVYHIPSRSLVWETQDIDSVCGLKFSRNGQTLVATFAHYHGVFGLHEGCLGTIKLFDVESGDVVMSETTYAHWRRGGYGRKSTSGSDIGISADSNIVVSCSSYGINVWNRALQTKSSFQTEHWPECAALSDDGRIVAIYAGRALGLYSTDSGLPSMLWRTPQREVGAVAVLCSSGTVVYAADEEVYIVDLSVKEERFCGSRGGVTGVSVDLSNGSVTSSHHDDTISVWRMDTGTLLETHSDRAWRRWGGPTAYPLEKQVLSDWRFDWNNTRQEMVLSFRGADCGWYPAKLDYCDSDGESPVWAGAVAGWFQIIGVEGDSDSLRLRGL